ncbi:hypothetical protein E5288_WYG016191 [Bos mutus]|uniref:Large ribosomal subunit protein P2 n=1 Tax=Bos mutus TaxID=72004 RepID=A0A6B0RQY5_9CETA|nr:hypothetical protein [Bos mutus]
MRYVASYLLAALGGNSSPSAKDIKKILDSVGIEADDDRLNKVISELHGKNIEDVIAQGEVVFEALVCTVHSNPCRYRQAGQCAGWRGCGRLRCPRIGSTRCGFCSSRRTQLPPGLLPRALECL